MSATNSKKNLLILGATGPTGIITVRKAIQSGHKTTIFARNVAKLPEDIRETQSSPYVSMQVLLSTMADLHKIIEGQLSSTELLYPLLPTFDTIISLLGPTGLGYRGTFIAEFYQKLLSHLRTLPSDKIPYVLALSTVSWHSPSDSFSLTVWSLVNIIWLMANGANKEIITTGKVFEQYGNDLPWTLYRVGYLSDGEEKGLATTGYVGPKWTFGTSKKDLALWLVMKAELDKSERKWVGKTLAIYSGAEKKGQ